MPSVYYAVKGNFYGIKRKFIAGDQWKENFADGSFASAKKGASVLQRAKTEKVRSEWWYLMARGYVPLFFRC